MPRKNKYNSVKIRDIRVQNFWLHQLLILRKCLIQIPKNIVDIFDTNAQPDEIG